MEFRRLGSSELTVSACPGRARRLDGSSRLGMVDDTNPSHHPNGHRPGINLLDTAPSYGRGHSERLSARPSRAGVIAS